MELRYFVTGSGRSPVEEFIDSLRPKARAKVLRALDSVQERGPAVGPPLVKPIVGKEGLWEVRVRFASDSYRVLFLVTGEGKALALHAFAKKTEKVLGRDIWVAVSRMKDFKGRTKP